MADLPSYVIKPSIARVLIPQFVITAVLGGVFYAGIALNVFLLGISIPASINILISVTIALLVITQALLTYVQTSKVQYSVYANRIQIEGPNPIYVMFNSIQDIQTKKNVLDNIFSTGTIVAGPNVELVGIPNFDQTTAYIKQMLQYSRAQYQ